jgi:hypothetical protein
LENEIEYWVEGLIIFQTHPLKFLIGLKPYLISAQALFREILEILNA